jgi:Mif2/CENP-C like
MVTLPFFGAGVVEIPPGGYKHEKNARAMHLCFFVHKGKVDVFVAGTRFSIGPGGAFQVPRGTCSFRLFRVPLPDSVIDLRTAVCATVPPMLYSPLIAEPNSSDPVVRPVHLPATCRPTMDWRWASRRTRPLPPKILHLHFVFVPQAGLADYADGALAPWTIAPVRRNVCALSAPNGRRRWDVAGGHRPANELTI